LGAGYRAAEIHAVALRHDAMNADLTAKPRMIPIENLAELGSVGVPKPCCTITIRRHSTIGYLGPAEFEKKVD